MTSRAFLAAGLLLVVLAAPALAQESPTVGGPQEGYNTTEDQNVGQGPPQGAPGRDPQNVGGYQAARGSGLIGLLVILALVGLGYLWFRRRGGRLTE